MNGSVERIMLAFCGSKLFVDIQLRRAAVMVLSSPTKSRKGFHSAPWMGMPLYNLRNFRSGPFRLCAKILETSITRSPNSSMKGWHGTGWNSALSCCWSKTRDECSTWITKWVSIFAGSSRKTAFSQKCSRNLKEQYFRTQSFRLGCAQEVTLVINFLLVNTESTTLWHGSLYRFVLYASCRTWANLCVRDASPNVFFRFLLKLVALWTLLVEIWNSVSVEEIGS